MKVYSENDFDIETHGDELHVTLNYPNIPEAKIRHIVVDQMSVRASDGLRLHYDYHRDGFVIEQASTFAWAADDDVCDPDWQEVAFIASWAREKEVE